MDLREVEALLKELEARTDRLRALYEQYFMGFERLEPLVARKDVERRLQQLQKIAVRNTALRFRFTTLQQKYTSYQSYWTRVCRQIEEGTYRRQLQKLKASEQQLLDNATKPQPRHEVVWDETPAPAAAAPAAKASVPDDDDEFEQRKTVPRMAAVRLPDGFAPPAKPLRPAIQRAAGAAAPTAPEPAAPKRPQLVRTRPVELEPHDTVPNLPAVQLEPKPG